MHKFLIFVVSVCCSLDRSLSYSSPVYVVTVVFLDHGHLCFWNFYSTIPVDVARVKSYVNRLVDRAYVPMWITIKDGCPQSRNTTTG